MQYAESHEWITVQDSIGTVGISAYALSELGEVVYVELPEVGTKVAKDQEAVVLESTKAAADIYTPVSGEIIAVNTDGWAKINEDPEGAGWLFQLRLSNPSELSALLSPAAYQESIK